MGESKRRHAAPAVRRPTPVGMIAEQERRVDETVRAVILETAKSGAPISVLDDSEVVDKIGRRFMGADMFDGVGMPDKAREMWPEMRQHLLDHIRRRVDFFKRELEQYGRPN